MTCTVGNGRPEPPISDPMLASSSALFAAMAGGIRAVQRKTAKAKEDAASVSFVAYLER